jgi:hypothetical protein
MEEKMKEDFKWFWQERAEQLSIVYLTRRDDLIVERKKISGLDLLVTLSSKRRETGRIFGVEARALQSPKQVRRADEDEYHINIKNLKVPRDIPFPLCLFVFVMETDEGYYRWLKEPLHSTRGSSLFLNEENTFRRLDNESLAEIIAEVSAWYESRLKIPA